MAGEIYIADKKTLDEVKKDTQYIKNQFPVTGGTDWSKYKSIIKKVSYKFSKSGYLTILDVSGSGYINCIFAMDDASDRKLRITLDGVEILNEQMSNSGYSNSAYTGIYKISRIYPLPNGHWAVDSIDVGRGSCFHYYFSGQENKKSFVFDQLFYKKNLKIEIYSPNNSGGGNLFYDIGVEG